MKHQISDARFLTSFLHDSKNIFNLIAIGNISLQYRWTKDLNVLLKQRNILLALLHTLHSFLCTNNF